MGRCGAALSLALEGNIGTGGDTGDRGGGGGSGRIWGAMGGGGAGCGISGCELMAAVILIGIAVGGTPKPRAPESWEGEHEGSPRARDAQAHSTFSAAGKGGTPKLIPGSRGRIGVTQARPTFPGARKGHTKAYPSSHSGETPGSLQYF